MANLRFCLFLAALCSCSVLGLGEETVPSLKDTETVVIPAVQLPLKDKDVTPVKEEEVPLSVTTVDDSDAEKHHNTTTSSTTTTTTTTTTTPPTTTSSTTSTTTTTTTTTTPAPPKPPTPPPKPQPVPAPDQGTWAYTDSKNTSCIVVQFAAQITLTYSQSVMNKTTIANVTMNVPANATVLGGDCNATATDQWMMLGWPSVQDGPEDNSILLWYRRNETTNTYALHTFNLTINATNLVNMSVPIDVLVLTHGQEWSTPLATSYRCIPVTKISMSNETYSASASVAVSRLQEEAFRSTPGKSFSAARECGGGDVPDTVPIAVGCALGGLVLVVLIAYLVARHRSAARGYLSM